MRVVYVIYFALIQVGLSPPETQAHILFAGPTEVQSKTEEFPNLKKLVMPPAVQRVVGGEVTTIDQVGGFIVSLRYRGNFVCGGSLLSSRIVLSAAHCFIGRLRKDLWTVTGGVSRLTDDGTLVPVKDYVIPSAFQEESMNMDVAVVLLAKDLHGKSIANIKLCNTKLTPNLLLTVSGWGLTDPDATHPHQTLRSVMVPIIKKKSCKNVYQKSISITKSMFCAGVLGKKDACTFDSGGPFVYKDNAGNAEVCGIVSFGISCASAKYPGVYTDVNYVKPFILTAMKNFGQ